MLMCSMCSNKKLKSRKPRTTEQLSMNRTRTLMMKKMSKMKGRNAKRSRRQRKIFTSILQEPMKGRTRSMQQETSRQNFASKMFLLNTKGGLNKFLFRSFSANLKKSDLHKNVLFGHMQGQLYSQKMKKYINLSDLAQQRAKKFIKKIGQQEGRKGVNQQYQSHHQGYSDKTRIHKDGLFGELGIQTLMDISISQIRNKPLYLKQEHAILMDGKETSSFQKGLQSDIQLMRKKLKILNQQDIKINYLNQQPPSKKQENIGIEQQLYLREIRSQIRKQQINKAFKLILKGKLRQFLRDVVVFDLAKGIIQKKRTEVKRSCFEEWAVYAKEHGERKYIMQAIRNRIAQKRKEKQIQEKMQFVHMSSKVEEN